MMLTRQCGVGLVIGIKRLIISLWMRLLYYIRFYRSRITSNNNNESSLDEVDSTSVNQSFLQIILGDDYQYDDVKIAEIVYANVNLCRTNKRLTSLFQSNLSSSGFVGTQSWSAHIFCDQNTGRMEDPEKLGRFSLQHHANIYIFKEDNTSQSGSRIVSVSSTEWIPTVAQHFDFKWYIYYCLPNGLSALALMVLIETEYQLNKDVFKDGWDKFVMQKLRRIRNDMGFLQAILWLHFYNKKHGREFMSRSSLWRLQAPYSSDNINNNNSDIGLMVNNV